MSSVDCGELDPALKLESVRYNFSLALSEMAERLMSVIAGRT